jgi:hypothetical protein
MGKGSKVDTGTRRDLDRTRVIARFAGICRGCNQHYPVGTPVTPVKGLGAATLWAHWQPDLACSKAADSFIRSTMIGAAQNRQHRKHK